MWDYVEIRSSIWWGRLFSDTGDNLISVSACFMTSLICVQWAEMQIGFTSQRCYSPLDSIYIYIHISLHCPDMMYLSVNALFFSCWICEACSCSSELLSLREDHRWSVIRTGAPVVVGCHESTKGLRFMLPLVNVDIGDIYMEAFPRFALPKALTWHLKSDHFTKENTSSNQQNLRGYISFRVDGLTLDMLICCP